MQATFFNWKNNVLTLHVLIQPNASRDEISGVLGDRLKIRLKASPIDGKANQYLIQYLAKNLNLPKKAIRILKGARSRQKTLSLELLENIPEIIINATKN